MPVTATCPAVYAREIPSGVHTTTGVGTVAGLCVLTERAWVWISRAESQIDYQHSIAEEETVKHAHQWQPALQG
jgi:hypothetical protein